MAKKNAAPEQTRLFGPNRTELDIIGGDRRLSFADLYHFLLGTSWGVVLAAVVVGFLLLNALFAVGYLAAGGVANARAGSYADAFFFSVQTMGTIGYGAMFPQTPAAHALVVLEAITGMLYTALVTGLLFAKFARPTARVMFSNVAVVSDREGVPTLMFRVANHRRNHVVEAHMRVGLTRMEVTREGERIRRVHDLDLVRSQTPAFVLTWTVLHAITEGSPLHGETAETLKEKGVELVLTLTGIDDTLSQNIHARHSYVASEIVFAARFEDLLSTDPLTGRRRVDYRKFHQWVPSTLTAPGPKPPA